MTTGAFAPEPDSRVVDEHRQYWRPLTTRLVLLAESHVFTTAEELKRSIRVNHWIPATAPRGFVRLVYCLGYGENDILDNPIEGNAGTPQYWKIFHSCLYGSADCRGILKSKTPIGERIQNKVRLLETLKAQGIWLVDASVNALYHPGNLMPKLNYDEVLRTSWREQVRANIQAVKPEGILCIGQGVARALAPELRQLQINWGLVPQPQARLSRDEHVKIHETYCKVACQPSQVSGLSARWSRDHSSGLETA